MNDDLRHEDARECPHGLLVRDDDCPDCADARDASVDLPVPPAAVSPKTPVRVSLSDLAKVSASTPLAQMLKRQPTPFDQRPAKTPAGLPQGCAWLPHDTGKRGGAARRRLAQRARLAAKRGATT